MSDGARQRLPRRWLPTAAVIAVFVVCAWLSVPSPKPVEPAAPATSAASNAVVTPDPAALRYAEACRAGRWDDVVDLTAWMQERLLRVNLSTADIAARKAAREELIARLRDRSVEGNQLRPEGVEDPFVFAAGTQFEPVRVDAGPTDLERPARSRSWFRVTYPEPVGALRDEAGAPIRSLVAGVTVSTDGYVLKASVLGNLEIERGSLTRTWD